MGKRKADYTPEGWQIEVARRREYNARPEVRDRARRWAAGEKNQQNQQTWREKNRDKLRKYSREWHAKPENRAKAHVKYAKPEVKAARRDAGRKRRASMPVGMVAALWVTQNGRCAVCGGVLVEGYRTHADHCHATKEPRGLLCNHCNAAEGHIRLLGLDPVDFGTRLAQYLANPPAQKLNF